MTDTAKPQEPVPGLEDDEAASRIVREEMRLLRTVMDALAASERASGELKDARARDDARLLELRDEVSDAKPEDLPALFEQMHHLSALQAQRGKGTTGSLDRKTPYFGHLRLLEDGRRRDVLIGSRAFVDPQAGVRVVDWRNAPVSRIFYRYQEDDDYEEELGGRTVEGKVLARRNVSIVGGELVRVSTPQGIFVRAEGGVWRRMDPRAARLWTEKGPRLGASGATGREKLLPAIASMLDAKQFDLISRPGSGLVAIQGSAGSGKTTVGLHRAAYLAFSDSRRFRPEKILVVVPNEALLHFVEHVLPDLGVEGVKITTFARLSAELLPELFPKLPSRVRDDTPPVVARAKGHAAMLRALANARDRVVRSLDARVAAFVSKWPGSDSVGAAWRATVELTVPELRAQTVAAWLAGERAIEGVPPAQLAGATRDAAQKLASDLRNGARVVLGTWDELLTSRERLAETFADEPGFGPGQLDQIHEWCVRQARVRSEGERDGDTPTIDAEDRALLLRLWQLLRGPVPGDGGKPLVYHHAFIDEVQDASPIELRVALGLCSRDLCVTLAGDTAQRMLDDEDHPTEFDWNRLLDDLGVPHTKLEPLKVSYRSTAEITRFARGVLGPFAHEAEPIATRHGPSVELFEHGSQGEAVAFLADALRDLAREEPHATVAIVARFPQQADVYYDGLLRAEVPNVRRVAKQDFCWEPGFDVTDVRQTKGLEFDEVVLVDANASSYPATPQARHAMYVGATRAAHQLWCVASDAVSPIVREGLAAMPSGEPGPEPDPP